MSRYGNTPVRCLEKVTVEYRDRIFKVHGPRGDLTMSIPEGIGVSYDKDSGLISISLDSQKVSLSTAFQGLYRSLINNMVIGVSQGFEKKLELHGVGYRASVQGNKLDVQVGYSHPTFFEIPPDLSVEVEKKSGVVSIKGIDKQKVGAFAAKVRGLRPPEPYKGKGIRYQGEYVRKKAGKAAKK